MKKIIALVLVLLLVMGMNVSVFAQTTEPNDADQTMKVSGISDMHKQIVDSVNDSLKTNFYIDTNADDAYSCTIDEATKTATVTVKKEDATIVEFNEGNDQDAVDIEFLKLEYANSISKLTLGEIDNRELSVSIEKNGANNGDLVNIGIEGKIAIDSLKIINECTEGQNPPPPIDVLINGVNGGVLETSNETLIKGIYDKVTTSNLNIEATKIEIGKASAIEASNTTFNASANLVLRTEEDERNEAIRIKESEIRSQGLTDIISGGEVNISNSQLECIGSSQIQSGSDLVLKNTEGILNYPLENNIYNSCLEAKDIIEIVMGNNQELEVVYNPNLNSGNLLGSPDPRALVAMMGIQLSDSTKTITPNSKNLSVQQITLPTLRPVALSIEPSADENTAFSMVEADGTVASTVIFKGPISDDATQPKTSDSSMPYIWFAGMLGCLFVIRMVTKKIYQ